MFCFIIIRYYNKLYTITTITTINNYDCDDKSKNCN